MNIQNPTGRGALVSIDPGRNLGWSVFVYFGPMIVPGQTWGWVLRACGLVTSTATNINTQAAETCKEVQEKVLRVLWDSGFHPGQHPLSVCELMEWRPDDRRSNAQDLIRVATIGAAVAGMLSPEPAFVTPNEWKGQVPKEIMGSRILHSLQWDEANRAGKDIPTNLRHNVIDAVGIGLWAVGRMQRGGGK